MEELQFVATTPTQPAFLPASLPATTAAAAAPAGSEDRLLSALLEVAAAAEVKYEWQEVSEMHFAPHPLQRHNGGACSAGASDVTPIVGGSSAGAHDNSVLPHAAGTQPLGSNNDIQNRRKQRCQEQLRQLRIVQRLPASVALRLLHHSGLFADFLPPAALVKSE